jgi:hypothetical protein
MHVRSEIAFREWAPVVDALGRGEQIIILRKGGVRENRGEFLADHRKSWLFPTQFHEAERSITADATPVLTDAESAAQREETCELVSGHALAHP